MSQNPVLAVCTFQSLTDPDGFQDFLDWETFTTTLMFHTSYERKEEGLLWSPTDYVVTNGTNRIQRRAAGVRALSALVIDIDDGTPFSGLPSGLKIFEFIVHTTWSHRPDGHHYRIILPLRCAVAASDWKDFYAATVPALSGGHADLTCSDTSRCYFYPQHPHSLVQGFSRRNPGKLLSSADFHLEMLRIREARQQQLDFRADFPQGGT